MLAKLLDRSSALPGVSASDGQPLQAGQIHEGVPDRHLLVADHRLVLSEGPLAGRDIEDREMKRDERMELENRIAMGRRFSTTFDAEALGPPSGYTCPDCNGSLLTVSDDNYRCRAGHAWPADALLGARDDEVEGALWGALRSLQERAKMSRRLAERVGSGGVFDRYTRLAEEAGNALTVLGRRLAQTSPGNGERSD